MSDLTFVQGDTAPPIRGALTHPDGSVLEFDADDAVKFQMRKADDKKYTVNADADITDAPHGLVSYGWADNDLDVPGEYIAQWEITYADGKVQTTQPANTVTVRRQ